MLTADDIRQARFESAGRGYKKSDVDDLLDDAADSLEQLQKENAELTKKLDVLVERIRQYRDEEDSIHAVLLTAQKSADQIMKQANADKERIVSEARQLAHESVRLSEEKSVEIVNETREKVTLALDEAKEKAAAMLSEAKAQSEQMLTESKRRSEHMLAESVQSCREEQEYLEALRNHESDYRQMLMELYKRQFELLKKGPEIERRLDSALFGLHEPASLQNAQPISANEEPVSEPEEPIAPVDEEPVAEQEPEPLEPEDIPLPVAGLTDYPTGEAEEEQEQEPESEIKGGFAVKSEPAELQYTEQSEEAAEADEQQPAQV